MFVFHTSDHYHHRYNVIADQRLHGRYHSPLSRALAQFTGALGQVGAGGDQDLDNSDQSVTSRLETSRYRDFSQFFESISLGLEKKSQYQSQK